MRGRPLLPLLLLAACAGTGGVQMDEFPSRYAQVVCARSAACCTPAAGRPEPECRARTAAALAAMVPVVRASTERRRSVYHPDRAEACLDAIAAIPCAEWRGGLEDVPAPACGGVIEPRVDVGGACGADLDCTSGFCDGELLLDSAREDGVCRARTPAGGGCREDAACVEGAYCGGGRCLARKEDGAACAADVECRSGTCSDETRTCGGTPPGDRCHAGCALGGGAGGGICLALLALIARALIARRAARAVTRR